MKDTLLASGFNTLGKWTWEFLRWLTAFENLDGPAAEAGGPAEARKPGLVKWLLTSEALEPFPEEPASSSAEGERNPGFIRRLLSFEELDSWPEKKGSGRRNWFSWLVSSEELPQLKKEKE